MASSPVHLEGPLDPQLSRWKWPVKWLLALPHYVVLAALWVAFTVLTVAAGAAILVTGRYPPSLFTFNVGVLRWTWRVAFYTGSAAGTDQYPPFTLRATNYPARLEVDYPAHLSQGLVLVKRWLLVLPQYVVVGILTSGVLWAGGSDTGGGPQTGGLIGVLVLVGVVVLLFTGTYPRGIFDLVVGLDRWCARVVVYAALMTDQYPPFRLDTGELEPAPTSGTGPVAA